MDNFLKLRKTDEQLDLTVIEQKLGFHLPVLYKHFIATFHLGNGNIMYESYLNPVLNKIVPCVSIVYTPLEGTKDLYFNGLFNTEELLQDWEEYSQTSDEWNKYKLLRIADIGVGGGLFVGIDNPMKDKIYRVVWDWKEDYELISENIWEFYKGLGVKKDYSNLRGYQYSDLYKLWGEDFWRVKE